MKTPIIDENNYSDIMINEVEPFLAERRNEGTFNSFDGRPISYEYYITDNAKASVVISHGFTESAEKFREMSYYFINEGYNVFAITHRGHGASYKESIDPYTVYVSEFNDYIKDFYTFIKRIVTPNSGSLPLYLYAHSMGGAIAALTLEQHPEIFKKAVLNAPMIHFKSPLPIPMAKAVTETEVFLGRGKHPVITTKPFDVNRTYEQSHDTSKARFDYYQKKRVDNVNYQTSRPSYSWVRQAIKIIPVMLDENNCKNVKADVLLFQAGKDTSVELPAQDEFISKIPSGELVSFPEAKHEIYMAENKTLKEYLDRLFDFLEE